MCIENLKLYQRCSRNAIADVGIARIIRIARTRTARIARNHQRESQNMPIAFVTESSGEILYESPSKLSKPAFAEIRMRTLFENTRTGHNGEHQNHSQIKVYKTH